MMLYKVAILTMVFLVGCSKEPIKEVDDLDIGLMANQLVGLVEAIEKIKNDRGVYPNTLLEIQGENEKLYFVDFLSSSSSHNCDIYFETARSGDAYMLQSAGIDGILGNEDDVFPNFEDLDTTSIGWFEVGDYSSYFKLNCLTYSQSNK
jgi:hypothetical protein